jgi:hypothetical protein
MRFRDISYALALVFFVFGISPKIFAQDNYRLSAPFTYKNLTVFLIHGKDKIKGDNILTLQEALEKKILIVYETSDVNELIVENLSSEFEVFIQSGDIVKGGKQDRVIAVSIILPVRSGKISIQVYCVESGRWEKRSNEDSTKFSSSNERIVTKDLKLATNNSESQSKVWSEVSETQEKLSQNVGGTVNSAASRTSLQLSLENKKVVAAIDEYVKKLGGIAAKETDVIGYAFVINGEINSADVYASSKLFKKLWPKLLKASATEAVAELKQDTKFAEVTAKQVKDFLDDAERGKTEEKPVTKRVTTVKREQKESVVFEARDEKQKVPIHRSYVKKQ